MMLGLAALALSVKKWTFWPQKRVLEDQLCGWDTCLFSALARRRRAWGADFSREADQRRTLDAHPKLKGVLENDFSVSDEQEARP